MKDSELNIKKKQNQYHDLLRLFLLLLTVALLIFVFTSVLQLNFRTNALEGIVNHNTESANVMYKTLCQDFIADDFLSINSESDKSSYRYIAMQKRMNEMRTMTSARYLYTAKRNADGDLIYVIDGLNKDASDFRNPGDKIEDEMIPYIEKAMNGESVISQDIVDTNWGHIFTACYPVRNQDDEVIGALCVEMDMEYIYSYFHVSQISSRIIAIITVVVAVILIVIYYNAIRIQRKKQKEHHHLLEKSMKEADAANKAKSTFLFNISHDIRTPMNAIIGYADLSEKHLDDKDILKHYVENIKVCGEKMLSIIDSVLELSRIENNEIVISNKITNISEGFDSCIAMFEAPTQEKNQKLITCKNIIYPYVYLDGVHVSEIILNIVSNAIKYTQYGGEIHVSIKQVKIDDNSCEMIIAVQDNGIGMSKGYQKHIFESFSREKSSTVSGIEGTGLGMGIVKRLVDLMNGEISLESELGKGSKFTVKIPCVLSSKEELEANTLEVDNNYEEFEGKRLLLAEDNEINAEIATELLSEYGFVIERVDDGANCVNRLKEVDADYYELILMDIQMPTMDGYEATRQIRQFDDKIKAGIPIIAMTANAFVQDKEKAFEVGMNDYVAKPIDMTKLLKILSRYIS